MEGRFIMFKFYPELIPTRFDVPLFSRVDFWGEMDPRTISELKAIGSDVEYYPRIEVRNAESNTILEISEYYPSLILAFKDAKRISKNYRNAMCVVFCKDYERTYTNTEIILVDRSGHIQVDVNE